ncbi:MAG: hypothetical protein JAZ06_04100 [Candidatus Thiodiazotropha taylori]|nr:hypothetical protein [Candidatus Thiodiazotropha taylori]
MSIKLTTIGSLTFLLAMHSAWSIDLDSDYLRLSGFGTIGVVSGGDDHLGFRREISKEGQFDGDWALEPDSLLGIQIDAQISDSLIATAQLVGKDRPDNSVENSLEWAFVRYGFDPGLVIRAGRMGTDLFMLSEYRNVGFAYLWARPPVEFYGPLALDSFNGIDTSYSREVFDGVMRFKVFYGGGEQDFSSQVGSHVAKLEDMIGANITWESEHWTTRAVYQQAEFASSIDTISPLVDGLSAIPAAVWSEAPGLAEDLEAKGKPMDYYALGLAYDDNPWVVQAEVGFIDSGYEAAFPDLLTAYLSVGRRFGPITLFGIGAIARNTQDTLDVPAEPSGGTNPTLVALQQGTQMFADQVGIDQRTLSLGMRWDLRHDLALKAQWDRTWVDAYGGALWDQAITVRDDRILDTFSVNFNFLF